MHDSDLINFNIIFSIIHAQIFLFLAISQLSVDVSASLGLWWKQFLGIIYTFLHTNNILS